MADGSWIWINLATWSQLLEAIKPAGVEIAYTSKSRHPYLKRTVGERILSAPLPKEFDPKNPDASGRVGVWVFDSVRRKLQIEDKYFKGWIRAFH